MSSGPAVDAYKARLLSYVEGKDPLAVQRQAGQILTQLAEGVPDSKLRERPAPDKWSVAELLAHFAEGEIAISWRYRQMLERDGVVLSGYDQELWHRLGDYASRKPEESLQLFRLLREANLRLLDKLTEEQWLRHGNHTERGRMTVRDMVRQVAGHDLNHLEQVRRALGR